MQAGGEVSASGVIAAFTSILSKAPSLTTGFIVLAHDLYQQSVDLAVGYILPDAIASTNPKFNITSIIDCLHQPLANACVSVPFTERLAALTSPNSYIETNNNSTNPPPNSVNATVATISGTATATTGSKPTQTGAASQLGISMAGLVGGITAVVFGALF